VIVVTPAQPDREALLARLDDALRRREGVAGFNKVRLLTDDRLFGR